jgi:hypothetical protein
MAEYEVYLSKTNAPKSITSTNKSPQNPQNLPKGPLGILLKKLLQAKTTLAIVPDLVVIIVMLNDKVEEMRKVVHREHEDYKAATMMLKETVVRYHGVTSVDLDVRKFLVRKKEEKEDMTARNLVKQFTLGKDLDLIEPDTYPQTDTDAKSDNTNVRRRMKLSQKTSSKLGEKPTKLKEPKPSGSYKQQTRKSWVTIKDKAGNVYEMTGDLDHSDDDVISYCRYQFLINLLIKISMEKKEKIRTVKELNKIAPPNLSDSAYLFGPEFSKLVQKTSREVGLSVLDICSKCFVFGHRTCRFYQSCGNCRNTDWEKSSRYFKEGAFHIPQGTTAEDFLKDLAKLSAKAYENRKEYQKHLGLICPLPTTRKCGYCKEPTHPSALCPTYQSCLICGTKHQVLQDCKQVKEMNIKKAKDLVDAKEAKRENLMDVEKSK